MLQGAVLGPAYVINPRTWWTRSPSGAGLSDAIPVALQPCPPYLRADERAQPSPPAQVNSGVIAPTICSMCTRSVLTVVLSCPCRSLAVLVEGEPSVQGVYEAYSWDQPQGREVSKWEWAEGQWTTMPSQWKPMGPSEGSWDCMSQLS